MLSIGDAGEEGVEEGGGGQVEFGLGWRRRGSLEKDAADDGLERT